MILISTSSFEFESSLRQVIDYEIDYLDRQTAILYMVQQESVLFDLYLKQMHQESTTLIHALHCYEVKELSLECLKVVKSINLLGLVPMSKVLQIALIRRNEEVLSLISSSLENLSGAQLEFLNAMIKYRGKKQQVSDALYIHRNTLMNRLNQFEQETKIDLRDEETLKTLEIMMIYQQYKG